MKYALLALLILLGGCRKEVHFIKIDLTSHGLPFSILAPDSAVIMRKDYGIINDITVRKGDGFNIQIFESEVTIPDVEKAKLMQLASIWQDKYFLELVREDTDGFIFKKQPDSISVDFDFRRIKIVGNKEYVFQAGVVGSFTLEEVTQMYNAVR